MLKNFKGFSLLETIVAIGILTIALLGVYSLTSLSISRASLAKNQNIAFFLAQEAEEYVSNLRLSNIVKGKGWLAGLGPCGAPPNDCYIDVVNDSLNPCSPTEGCPKIKFDGNTGSYNYDSGEDTVFTRIIRIERLDIDGLEEEEEEGSQFEEIQVIVEMQWQERGQTRSFILENHLFEWAS